MSENKPAVLEIPQEQKAKAGEPSIFSMPEKFRGLTVRVNPPVVKPAALPAAPNVIPPPPPKPPLLTKKKHGLSLTTKIIIGAGIFLFLVLVAAGLYVVLSLKKIETKKNQPNVSNQATNSVPVKKPSEKVEEPIVSEKPEDSGINQPSSSPFPEGTTPGRDTDSDGLTDVEELLYHTSSRLPDSDRDGFLDGNEVFNVYDPNAVSPASLQDSLIMETLKVKDFVLLYPKVWTKKSSETEENTVFVVPSGETITLGFETKVSNLSLVDWFSGTTVNAGEIKVSEGKIKSGFSALFTEDQMTVYVDLGEWVAIFSYQNTVKATVDYLQTFEMMMNSLKKASL